MGSGGVERKRKMGKLRLSMFSDLRNFYLIRGEMPDDLLGGYSTRKKPSAAMLTCQGKAPQLDLQKLKTKRGKSKGVSLILASFFV